MKKELIIIVSLIIITFFIVHITNNKDEEIILDTSYDVIVEDTSENNIVVSDPKTIVSKLQEKYNNKDIKALLRISDTTFKTPIPQAKNNEYYYRRLPNKKYSIIGSTFLDYRTKINQSKVLIIYGHNSSKYDMPFKVLENYYSKDYYEKHKYLELVVNNEIKKYEIFSVYVETSDFSYYENVEFKNNKEFLKHINNLKEKSFYDTNVLLNESDNILILQACSTHKKYQKYKNKFVLIISKEVKNDESN